jgi:uncharacterized membrane protein
MLRFEKSIVIDAPVEAVFAYTVDPTHKPEYFVGVAEVKDIQRLPNGGYTFTTVSKFLGLHTQGKTEQVEFVPNERFVAQEHTLFMDVTLSLRFEKLDSHKTLVSGYAEYTFVGGFLGKLIEPLLTRYVEHAAEMSLAALKAHIEVDVPAGATR